MLIEELKVGDEINGGEDQIYADGDVVSDAKRALVLVGARALFYPSLLCNVVRSKMQPEFHWWDRVDQFILLGAVPFPTDVPQLKELGVSAVVTLNEPYETLVPTSLYRAHCIDHLVIPTRDYLFAPSFTDISQAVDFIRGNASLGKTTYVHCKAGRGRSTTIVLCYLMEHRHMTPDAAYEFVRSNRPRVRLASAQWQAVQDYYLLKVRKMGSPGRMTLRKIRCLPSISETASFEDSSVVVVTESDLDGYDESSDLDVVGSKMMNELNLTCRLQFASQAAISRLSCLWLRCHESPNSGSEKLANASAAEQLESHGVHIQVY
ncbi:phosphatidylglycerophosphate phosphatase PTPMT1-like [Tripterygium wilfordii]|uniref:phosphatidylglycerophosphate phosphatase PTPMT1-like n=1 Tax=Tripterygium wilfordii TaxID=458696 RepID=UPI0018F7EED2|nr:phosphatidylglycerophosphate phosphatase PTPMT1-like [Tripterygium wilfordii]